MAFGTSSKTMWSGKRSLLLFRRSRVCVFTHNNNNAHERSLETCISSDIRFVVDFTGAVNSSNLYYFIIILIIIIVVFLARRFEKTVRSEKESPVAQVKSVAPRTRDAT